MAAYNPLRQEYDTAITSEEERLKSFASFDAPTAIPKRPVLPRQPPPFKGAFLDLNKVLSTPWSSAYATQGDSAYLVFGTNKALSPNHHTRNGYVVSTNSTTASPLVVTEASHVFGKLGQGKESGLPDAKAFYWGTG